MKFGNLRIRVLAPDVVLAYALTEFVIPGIPPLKGDHVYVAKNINGEWLVIESHMKIFPPPRQ